MDSPKMYIFINKNLNMTTGKMISQACHITHQIVDELVSDKYETFPPTEYVMTYMKWNNNCIKIILKGSEEQLLELLKLPMARGFYDSGNTTQGTKDCLTVVGFLPSSKLDIDLTKFKLL
jgi:peptidyl-tRNA hydrolase